MILDKVIEIIKILKPKFYNNITWAVVLCGISLIATPFWEPFIISLFNELGLVVSSSQNNEILGVSLVIIALIYHFATTALLEFLTFKSSQSVNTHDREKRDHDKRVFKQSQTQMSEQEIMNFLGILSGSHNYKGKAFARIADYAEFHKKPANQFIFEELRSSSNLMSTSILELVHWCSYKFFEYPENQKNEDCWYCMQPNLNMDRGGSYSPESQRKYDELTETLNSLILDVESKYIEYRRSVKLKCYI